MGLDDLVNRLLKPVKVLDEEVLRFYTRLGKNIPDEKLYTTTTKWQVGSLIPQFGLIGIVFSLAYQSGASRSIWLY